MFFFIAYILLCSLSGTLDPYLNFRIWGSIFGESLPWPLQCSRSKLRFYSMGDSKLFMNLQVLCQNAHSLGGSILGLLIHCFCFLLGRPRMVGESMIISGIWFFFSYRGPEYAWFSLTILFVFILYRGTPISNWAILRKSKA